MHGKSSAISCLALILVAFLSLGCFGCGGGQAAPVTSPHSAQLSIQPSSVNLSTTGTQQFSIAGAPAGAAVSWTVNGVVGGSAAMGTISSNGMYQAPAAVPTAAITISAMVAGSTVAAPTATVTVTPSTSGPLTISPSPVTVLLLGTQQFQVSGAGSGSVTWSVNQIAGGNATVGTISSGGLYTPPVTVPAGLVEVEATSQNPSATAKAAVTLQYPPVNISSITPTQIPAGTASQNLTVTGTGFGSFSQFTINGVAAVFDPSSPFTSTQFTIQVPQPLMVFATTLTVGVSNPVPGGGLASISVQVVGGPPSMLTPRADHTATLLNNGKVLIAGGRNVNAAGLNGLNTAELYDPVAKTFTASHGTMSTTRTRHTATLLLDGTVLLAGGDNSTTVTTADIYDPSTDSFHATAGHMTTVRASGHGAALLPNGKVLIAGGDYPPTNQGFPGTAELFDPATGTFTATGAMNEFREFPTVTLLHDGTVLVAGGGAGSLGSGIDQTSLNSAELYDPAAGTFTTVSPMAVARAYHTATLLNDGSVLIAGGEQRHGCCVALPNAEVYLPASKSFSTVGSMAFPRVFHTATFLSAGTVHVIGGGDAITEIYDPTQSGFLQSISLQLPRTNHTATLLPNNGGILVCGGILPNQTLGNVITASCEIVP
jgi:Kelch motif/Galactose oxidase, central domain